MSLLRSVSPSALSALRECPQRWAYSYVERLERSSDTVAYPLEFGTWWHALRAACGVVQGYRAHTIKHTPAAIQLHDTDLQPLATIDLIRASQDDPGYTGAETVLSLCQRWWDARLTPEQRDGWVEYLGDTVPSQLARANRWWLARYPDAAGREILAVELPVTRELPGTPTALRGVVDVVYYDSALGLTVLSDYKALSDPQGQDHLQDMLSPQLHLYAYLAMPAIREWGFELGALSYDRVRSRAPKRPSLTTSGTLSRSVTDYDLETYREFVATSPSWGIEGDYVKTGRNAGKPKWGTYEADPEVLERLAAPAELDRWTDRTLTPLNPTLVRSHVAAASASAQLGAWALDSYQTSGATVRNLTRGCQWCDFRRLCAAQLRGGPGGEYPLAELGLRSKDSSTEGDTK